MKERFIPPIQYLESLAKVKELEAMISAMNHDLLEARKKEVILTEQRQRLLIALTFVAFIAMVEALVLLSMWR